MFLEKVRLSCVVRTSAPGRESIVIFKNEELFYLFAKIACYFESERCGWHEAPVFDSYNCLSAHSHSSGEFLLGYVFLGAFYFYSIFHR